MDYAQYDDRYLLKLNFLSPTKPDHPGPSSTTGMKQRITALVTNIRPYEPLDDDKIISIATRIPALSQMVSDTHFYDSSYSPLDSSSTVKILPRPYRPPPDMDSVRVAWKVFTGSKCRVYRPPRQPTAYGPTRPAQPPKPQPIPPVPLQIPWHPEEPEHAHVEMDLTTEYSSQTSANGESIYEILSQVKNAGGEEIPGLWRVSGYHMDGTVYLSVIIKIMEKKEKMTEKEKAAFSMLRNDNDSQDNEPPLKKRPIYI